MQIFSYLTFSKPMSFCAENLRIVLYHLILVFLLTCSQLCFRWFFYLVIVVALSFRHQSMTLYCACVHFLCWMVHTRPILYHCPLSERMRDPILCYCPFSVRLQSLPVSTFGKHNHGCFIAQTSGPYKLRGML